MVNFIQHVLWQNRRCYIVVQNVKMTMWPVVDTKKLNTIISLGIPPALSFTFIIAFLFCLYTSIKITLGVGFSSSIKASFELLKILIKQHHH